MKEVSKICLNKENTLLEALKNLDSQLTQIVLVIDDRPLKL